MVEWRIEALKRAQNKNRQDKSKIVHVILGRLDKIWEI